MFNWIPTIPEIFSKVECTIGGHSWKYFVHNGKRFRTCQNCEKSEWV